MINVEYDYIAEKAPSRLRKTFRRIDWLKLLLSMYKTNRDMFTEVYNRYIQLSAYTPQTISIEGLINDNFPTLSEPAYIIDGLFILDIYLGLRGETFIEPVYTFNRSEGLQDIYTYVRGEKEQGYSFFIVVSPSDIGYKDAIEGLVKQFKSGGRTFTVITTDDL